MSFGQNKLRRTDKPVLSVAICTRNRAGFLEQAVTAAAVQAQPFGRRVEILIIDNASTDQTAETCASLAKKYNSIRYYSESELGLSVARNRALRIARAPWIVFLDDDAVPHAGWLAAYVDFVSDPPPRVAVAGGPVHPRFEKTPPRWYGQNRGRLDHGGQVRRIPAHGGLWGCNLAYHRQRILEIGAFDSRLGRKGSGLAAHEETDLNHKLEAAGFEVWWVPGARIDHHITAQRLTLGYELRSHFGSGQSVVLGRLERQRSRFRRIMFATSRLAATPFELAAHLLAAASMLALARRASASSHLSRASRTLGVAFGICRNMPALASVSSAENATLEAKPAPVHIRRAASSATN